MSLWPRRATVDTALKVEPIQRVRVVEGDTIVYRALGKLSTAQVKRIDEQLTKLWPKCRIVVLEDGATLDVVAQPQTQAAAFADRLSGQLGPKVCRHAPAQGTERPGDELEGERCDSAGTL